MEIVNQKKVVLDVLKNRGTISNVWAVQNKIFRLSERIRELINQGHAIETYYEINKRTGKRVRTASYRLIKN